MSERKVTKSDKAKSKRDARRRRTKGKVSRADIKRVERSAIKRAKRKAERTRVKGIQERQTKARAEKASTQAPVKP